MGSHVVQPMDLDTEALASNLRELADGIESGDVSLNDLFTSTHCEGTDPAEAKLKMTYSVTDESVSALDIVSMSVWNPPDPEAR